ncbi:MAG: hypothetical protein AVDCRST_MAG50-2016 [uncultured Acidimicrobiales bacterium]|uniref:Peptide chain release factor 1 n=1 Tax=uncultured Acidimicrobiales bacterium TaxID=310071 RepID=A0A6J4I9T9_9ACTN|nr:MAG: hypothetical protein AVDCRST_MAG50-2016 [uncultured Acidimicrobiales bacterium]
MEASAPTPTAAVHAPDLVQLFEGAGPFVTVYLATEPAIENAGPRNAARWRALRDELAASGASEAALSNVDPLVEDANTEGSGLAVIATDSGVSHLTNAPSAPATDVGRWSPLPSVVQLLEWRQAAAAYVLVKTDRLGADLVAVAGAEIAEETTAGSDPGPHVRRSNPGGWSQRRFQQRAENSWEKNAKEVAAEIVRLVDQVDARLLIVGGDVRAVQLLHEELPTDLRAEVIDIDASRAVDGSAERSQDEADTMVATAVAKDTVGLLQKFKEERGQGDRAAEGPEATLAALSKAQVDVLLVHDDPADERPAWFGPQPEQVALTQAALRNMGAGDGTQARLVDVAVRAALGTGAAVRIVPGTSVEGGLAAILRWSDPT